MLLLLVVIFTVAGCAGSPVRFQDAKPVSSADLEPGYAKYSQPKDGYVKVVVVRDTRPDIRYDYDLHLKIDGIAVAKVSPEKSIVLYMKPGTYIFSATDIVNNAIEREFRIDKDTINYFRISLANEGYYIQRSTLLDGPATVKAAPDPFKAD